MGGYDRVRNCALTAPAFGPALRWQPSSGRDTVHIRNLPFCILIDRQGRGSIRENIAACPIIFSTHQWRSEVLLMKTLICTALVCLVQGAAFAQGAPPSAHPQPPSDAPPPPTPPPHAEVVDEVYKVTVGGEEVEVHLKPLTVRATTVAPDNGTGGFFNRLEPDARKGNDDAAHALYRSLETCKPFPKSRAELNASVEQGRAKWAATGGVQAPGDKPQ